MKLSPELLNPSYQKGLRALYWETNTLFGARGTRIFSSEDRGKTWQSRARLKLPAFLEASSHARILARLARTEIYKLHVHGDSVVALSRGGVYSGLLSQGELTLSFRVKEGSRPISLARGPDGTVYFGDYASNPHREEVRIYGSSDMRAWRTVHVFPKGEIRHVHGIFHDPYASGFWILTGDFGDEAGFLWASEDFSEVKWIKRGSQAVRAYTVLPLKNGIVYATDTEIEKNAIFFMSRDGSRLQKLHDLESSSFHATKLGDWFVFSTVCEPSALNDRTHLHLWASRDLKEWKKWGSFRKDRWPFLLQFGNLFFPEGTPPPGAPLVFSATALSRLDDTSVFASLPTEFPRNEETYASL